MERVKSGWQDFFRWVIGAAKARETGKAGETVTERGPRNEGRGRGNPGGPGAC